MEEIRKTSGALRRIATGIRTIRTADTAIPITGIRTARKTMATVTIAARTRIQRITEATAITIIETIRKITAMETAPSIRRMAVIIRGIRKIVRKILTREIRTIPRSVPVRTGRTKIARHRISDSWIPVRLLAVFWRLCRMALVLSEATIICRETTTSMFPLLRSAAARLFPEGLLHPAVLRCTRHPQSRRTLHQQPRSHRTTLLCIRLL